MNRNHSKSEMIYRKRWIGPAIQSAIRTFPVVVISGARQVGKSTFLQNEFPDFKYLSLDDFSVLQQVKEDPLSLWVNHDRVILDEAQKAPEIFSAIKLSVDRARRKTRFLISGSSNLLLLKGISETLAGRAVYFEMFPMSYEEMYGKNRAPENFHRIFRPECSIKETDLEEIDPLPSILKGFMPPLMSLDGHGDVLLWWEGYVKTYLERDLRDLSQVESLVDFRRVLESVAVRTASLLNQTEISRDTGVSQPTVYRYIKLLEVSNIIKRVPGYFRSRSKRVTKTPKQFVVDPGLGVFLSGYHDGDSLRKAREWGAFFETAVFLHLKNLSEMLIPKGSIFYWRGRTGKEVDFIIEQGKKVVAFEAKLTRQPLFHDARNLIAFIDEHPQTLRGILLHGGKSIKWLHSKVLAVPWWWIGI